MLKQARSLYDLGFAIIWLKPKSKMPVKSGWTTGPRDSWESLKKDYRTGYNIGVRLGRASRLENGYLGCLDMDVKDPAYFKKALTCAEKVLGGKIYPQVASGSGNGSAHFYFASPKPFPMVQVEKHKGKWEVCLYSEGRQMVLPPSIHPDTGSPYLWVEGLKEGIPKLSVKGIAPQKTTKKVSLDGFKPVPVDIVFSDLPKEIIDLLLSDDLGDKSATLLYLTTALVKHKFSDVQILSVLTDQTYPIGEVGYAHAQTKSRQKAAEWIKKYTLDNVKADLSAAAAFSEEVVERSLTDEAAQAQEDELIEPIDWEKQGYRSADKKRTPNYVRLMEAFEEEHPFKTVSDMRAVYAFNGTHYEHVTPIEIKGFAERKFKPAPLEKERVEFYAKVIASNIVKRTEFFSDSIESKINFKNGVLDLNEDSRELLPHSPSYGFRGVLPYDYDPDAECPIFKKWLSGIMLGDTDLQKILQEYMGYVVRGGDYKYHKALWLGGVGRNGKSTFIDLLKALIGVGNYSVISIKALVNDKFVGADLDGKIANFSEETSPEELKDSGPFKNLTGDGDTVAQKKYGDPFSFRNRAKLIMTYNRIPDLTDLSAGMLSRPIIIPFNKVIGEREQDHNIKKKLFTELPGIFNFAMRGWNRLERQGGFTNSKKSSLALQRVREESCNVYQWVENYIEQVQESNANEDGVSGDMAPIDLYEAYKKNERYAYKMSEFYKRMNMHPIINNPYTKKKIHGRIRYRNIKFRTHF